MGMPIGMIALLVIGVLIYFGVAQRILDRMRLTDKQALFFIVAIGVGSFIDIPISQAPIEVSINVGGAVLPALLAIWLIFKADETAERVRAMFAALLVAASIALGSRYLPYEPENMFLDPKFIYGTVAGLIAYLAGRSRRSAFIGAVLGVVLSDVVHYLTLRGMGIAGRTDIGGAGAFDVVMIAGVVAVMVAELIGETREKIQGGPELGKNRPEGLYEFSEEFQHERQSTALSQSPLERDSEEPSGKEDPFFPSMPEKKSGESDKRE